MAKTNEETKTKKTTSNKSTTAKKNNTKKTTTKKTSNAKSTPKTSTSSKTTSTKKTTVKSTTPKKTVKKTATKKKTTKPVEEKKTVNNKELEKTLIIENIENEIDKIVENKNNIKIKEQVVEQINDKKVAKVEEAKYSRKKNDKKLLAIGVIISALGIIALIITLIANRTVDKEFISDTSIALMAIASILIECFGSFIIINEV